MATPNPGSAPPPAGADDPTAGIAPGGGDNDGDEGPGGDGDIRVLITMHADGKFTVETEADGDEGAGQTEPDTHPQPASSLVEALHIARSIFEQAPNAHEGQADADMMAGYKSAGGPMGGMGGMPG